MAVTLAATPLHSPTSKAARAIYERAARSSSEVVTRAVSGRQQRFATWCRLEVPQEPTSWQREASCRHPGMSRFRLAVDPIHVRHDGLLEDWGCDPPSPQGARWDCTVTLA